jgi:HTH-type transcriptional regulator / antitoxin HipB
MSKKPPLAISTRAADQLGAAIVRFRKQAAKTQQNLAESAGLRQATISKAEQGTANTEIGTIYAICAALGLELVLQPRGKQKEFKPEEMF